MSLRIFLFFSFFFSSITNFAQILDIGDTLKLSTINYGLVGYYPFTGNAGDSSGTGNHGTEKNGVALTSDRFGNPNSAYLFDGINDYIEIADDNSLDVTDSFSITLWMNQYNSIAGGYRLFDKTTVGINDGYNFDTYGTSGRKLRLTGGSANVEASVSVPLNNWNQVLVIHYKDSTYLYQNSTFIGKGIQKNILSNNLTAKIGSNQNGGNYFNGKIDDIRVYNRALCDLEIKVIYGLALTLGVKASSPNVCSGSSTNINIVSPQPYMKYKLLKASDSSLVGSTQSSPCSDTLRFSTGQVTQNTSFIFRAIDVSKNDSIYLDTTITIFVLKSYNDTLDTTLCSSSGIFFNGQVRNATGYYVGNFKTTNGCDSIVTLHLQKSTPINYIQNISACLGDSSFLQNAYQKSTGTYYDTIIRIGFCDSIIESNLIINNPASSYKLYTLCIGDSITVNGRYLKNQGLYYDTLTVASTGCDSIVESELLVLNPTSYSSYTICTGDSMLINGRYLKNQGLYYDTLVSIGSGCDSIIQSNLKVLNIPSAYRKYTICVRDSILVNGRYFKNTGLYYDTLTSNSGCDSLLTIEIDFRFVKTDTITTSICSGDSILLLTNYYKTSGFYSDSIYIGGCLDSIRRLQLTVLPTHVGNSSYQICGGDFITINGKQVSKSGIYYDSLKNSFGCDSIIIINLTVTTPPSSLFTFKFCYTDSIAIDGVFYNNDTIFYDTLKTSFGCDSILIVKLTPGGVTPTLDDSAFFCEDILATLDAGDGYNSYLWSTGSTSQFITPNTQNAYWVTVTDSFNCTFTDTILLLERCLPKIFIPTAFSPGSDGVNDFLIFSAENVSKINFRLFNRWGEMVFETNDINARWDGKYKGYTLPIGTYTWMASFEGMNIYKTLDKRNDKGILNIIK